MVHCTFLQVLQGDLSILLENCATDIQRYHELDTLQEKTVYFLDLRQHADAYAHAMSIKISHDGPQPKFLILP